MEPNLGVCLNSGLEVTVFINLLQCMLVAMVMLQGWDWFESLMGAPEESSGHLYIDTSVLYPGAKVCAALCVVGSVCWYNLVVGSGLHDCWVFKNLGPNTNKDHYWKKAARMFGKAIPLTVIWRGGGRVPSYKLC